MKKLICSKTTHLLAFFTITLLAACSKSDNNNGYNPPPPPTTTSIKTVINSQFGAVLADSNGRALYMFASDVSGTPSCTGGCTSLWPVFYVNHPTFATGLNANDFSSVQRTDGTQQLTYKGWPLYYYSGDNSYSNATGDGIEGLWFIAKPDYTLMIANGQLKGMDGNLYKGNYTPGTGNTVYIVDSVGRTLYSFTPDRFKKNNYTLSDFSNDAVWPIFQVGMVQNIPSILNKADFSSIQVFGKTQLTYKGWPLYYFGADAARGNTKGVSFPTPGIWPVVNSNTPVAPQ